MPRADLRVTLTADPELVATRTRDWVAADPVGRNVFATVLDTFRTGGRAPDGSTWALVSVVQDVDLDAGPLLAAAMHTAPHPAHLPAMPDQAAEAMARALHRDGLEVSGATGDVDATACFARTWQRLTGRRIHLVMDQGMLVLDDVPTPPIGVPGSARPAGEADLDLLVDWLTRFEAEIQHTRVTHIDRESVRREGRRLLLWSDGAEPVSLAGWKAAVAGTSRIGPVYTPPDRRGRGYAAAVTTAATLAARDAGATRTMLYTDLANPVSNRVYRRLGYRPVGRSSQWSFTLPS
jgi:RimJ/RimL family protein N-acetyltransferase